MVDARLMGGGGGGVGDSQEALCPVDHGVLGVFWGDWVGPGTRRL